MAIIIRKIQIFLNFQFINKKSKIVFMQIFLGNQTEYNNDYF